MHAVAIVAEAVTVVDLICLFPFPSHSYCGLSLHYLLCQFQTVLPLQPISCPADQKKRKLPPSPGSPPLQKPAEETSECHHFHTEYLWPKLVVAMYSANSYLFLEEIQHVNLFADAALLQQQQP
ncbi:hypothetical protein V8G54_000429 [Vigna mungo]|uniref:Uncharacterized protein n=1 Tax=Vigna mungo TaxID=3915 RepID=A0AAQ3P595_VIGMU